MTYGHVNAQGRWVDFIINDRAYSLGGSSIYVASLSYDNTSTYGIDVTNDQNWDTYTSYLGGYIYSDKIYMLYYTYTSGRLPTLHLLVLDRNTMQKIEDVSYIFYHNTSATTTFTPSRTPWAVFEPPYAYVIAPYGGFVCSSPTFEHVSAIQLIRINLDNPSDPTFVTSWGYKPNPDLTNEYRNNYSPQPSELQDGPVAFESWATVSDGNVKIIGRIIWNYPGSGGPCADDGGDVEITDFGQVSSSAGDYWVVFDKYVGVGKYIYGDKMLFYSNVIDPNTFSSLAYAIGLYDFNTGALVYRTINNEYAYMRSLYYNNSKVYVWLKQDSGNSKHKDDINMKAVTWEMLRNQYNNLLSNYPSEDYEWILLELDENLNILRTYRILTPKVYNDGQPPTMYKESDLFERSSVNVYKHLPPPDKFTALKGIQGSTDYYLILTDSEDLYLDKQRMVKNVPFSLQALQTTNSPYIEANPDEFTVYITTSSYKYDFSVTYQPNNEYNWNILIDMFYTEKTTGDVPVSYWDIVNLEVYKNGTIVPVPPPGVDVGVTLSPEGNLVITKTILYRTIRIMENDIVIDGGGNKMIGVSNYGNAIEAYNVKNITVRNIWITGYNNGIYLQNVNWSKFENSVLENNNYGIYVLDGSFNNITGNLFKDNQEYGVYITMGSTPRHAMNNTIWANIFEGNKNGLSLTGSWNCYFSISDCPRYNRVYMNNFNNTNSNAVLVGPPDNVFNVSNIGNWWSDYSGQGPYYVRSPAGDYNPSPTPFDLSPPSFYVQQQAQAAPDIFVQATHLDFGEVATGSSKELALVVENRGSAPLTLSLVRISEGQGVFTIVGNVPGSVAAGSSVEIRVSFTPTTEGPFTGTLTIVSDDPDSPNLFIVLTGLGAAPGEGEVVPQLPEVDLEVIVEKMEERRKAAEEAAKVVQEVYSEVLGVTLPAANETLEALKTMSLEDLLREKPAEGELRNLDRNEDGQVDILDIAQALKDHGVFRSLPPKAGKAFSQQLIQQLKNLYGPNLEDYPTLDGKIWVLALAKTNEE